jgi:hypothetical protein
MLNQHNIYIFSVASGRKLKTRVSIKIGNKLFNPAAQPLRHVGQRWRSWLPAKKSIVDRMQVKAVDVELQLGLLQKGAHPA